MGRRIDYYDDSEAPAANSMVPSVNVVVVSETEAEIVLIQRTDNGNWSLPGGAIELGESLSNAAVREVKEEAGIDCQPDGIVGIYTNPKHIIYYTSDGEARQEFSIVLTARAIGGQPTPSDESSDVRWVPRGDLRNYVMDRSMRIRVDHFLDDRSAPYLT